VIAKSIAWQAFRRSIDRLPQVASPATTPLSPTRLLCHPDEGKMSIWPVMGCLHDPANVQQTSSNRNAGSLLDVLQIISEQPAQGCSCLQIITACSMREKRTYEHKQCTADSV